MSEPSPSGAPEWYALSVKPRIESHVGVVLATHGFEIFLPTREVKRVRSGRTVKLFQPLFPQYLFARFRWADRLKIITSPGVRSILTMSGKPAPITDQEIERLRRAVRSPDAAVHDYLENGRQVRITSGPLQGLEGRLVETKSVCQLVINIDILHRAVSVVIDRTHVVPAALGHHA